MRNITATVQPLTAFEPGDQRQFATWIWSVKDFTQFDMDVMGYPRACMAKAEWEGKPLLYVPVQPVLMLESLASDPDLTKKQKAHALWKIVEEMDNVMRLTGMFETYFVTYDDEFAQRAVAAGFTEINGHVLKRKLNSGTIPSIK